MQGDGAGESGSQRRDSSVSAGSAQSRFRPVRRVNAYEQIVAQIEEQVRNGDLHAGDRLPSERHLMARFGVSRPTIREALRVLRATGLVDSRPGDPRGPVMLPFSSEVLRGPLERMVNQEHASRVELLQFRLVIDGQAALLAAIRQKSDAIARIDAAAQAISALSTAETILPSQFPVVLRSFHDAVREAASNRLLQVCGEAVTDALGVIAEQRLEQEPDPRARLRRSAADAAKLVNLIRAGDGTAAQHAATANIYRYYHDGLTGEERHLLEAMVENLSA